MRPLIFSSISCAVLATTVFAALPAARPASAEPGYAALHIAPAGSPSNLKCEGSTNPTGIDTAAPRLSWELPVSSSASQCFQTAWQAQAATSPVLLNATKPDLWDSGKVMGSHNAWQPYAGKHAKPASTVYWRVRIWTSGTKPGAWSKTACWDTGLPTPDAWGSAHWIAALSSDKPAGAPEFITTFGAQPGWIAARLFVCSAGYHTAEINDKPVDNRVLEPAQTDFQKRAFYSAYRAGGSIKPGHNVLRITLGNGWFNQDRVWGGMSYGKPAIKFRLVLEYPNGFTTECTSGSATKWRSGPIMADNIYAGESYDARRAASAELAASSNLNLASVLPASPVGSIVSSQIPPIRRTNTLKPLHVTTPKPGVLVYDMGQNFAGWLKLRLNAPAGTTVKLRFAEALSKESGKSGQIDTASTGVFATGVEQVDTYTCRGGGNEEWEPHFTYHGFRYAEITGLPAGARPSEVIGVVVHSDVPEIGSFECSDPMLNRIHHAAIWTLISNLHGQPTDCPARERCGWMGDAHGAAEMSALNFDMATFWSKYVGDIETSWVDVLPSQIAPGKRGTGPSGNPDWGAAVVLVPWYRYLYYGDRKELTRDYPSMARFVTALSAQAKAGIITNGYGDWCPPGSVEPVATPVPFTSTAWLIRTAEYAAYSARALGKANEAARFEEIRAESLNALRSRFYQPERHSFGSQTADAMALGMGLALPGSEQAVADALAADVVTHGYHHTTGIFGSRYLFDMLTKYGHGDVASRVLHQTTYPSIGNLFSLGATTFWECWGEDELDKKWGARSLNHPMQAAYDAWFYQGLAGINPDPAQPGFKHTILQPQLLPGLTSIRSAYRTPYGVLRSAWQQTDTSIGRTVRFQLEIPANTLATFKLPSGLRVTAVTGNTGQKTRSVTDILELTPGKWDIEAAGDRP